MDPLKSFVLGLLAGAIHNAGQAHVLLIREFKHPNLGDGQYKFEVILASGQKIVVEVREP